MRDCSLHRASRQIKTASKGIIRKECQSFTNHGHDKTTPTVFNPLSLWLTLPRDMGVSHTLWPPSITRATLACPWFAQGLHRNQKSKQQSHSCVTVVCTGHLAKSKQLPRALSAKNANHLQTTDTIKRHQRYSIRYHCGWPSLGIWGSATHYGLPALPEPLLRDCGLHRNQKSKQQSHSCVPVACTGFARHQKIKTAEPLDPAV